MSTITPSPENFASKFNEPLVHEVLKEGLFLHCRGVFGDRLAEIRATEAIQLDSDLDNGVSYEAFDSSAESAIARVAIDFSQKKPSAPNDEFLSYPETPVAKPLVSKFDALVFNGYAIMWHDSKSNLVSAWSSGGGKKNKDYEVTGATVLEAMANLGQQYYTSSFRYRFSSDPFVKLVRTLPLVKTDF